MEAHRDEFPSFAGTGSNFDLLMASTAACPRSAWPPLTEAHFAVPSEATTASTFTVPERFIGKSQPGVVGGNFGHHFPPAFGLVLRAMQRGISQKVIDVIASLSRRPLACLRGRVPKQ